MIHSSSDPSRVQETLNARDQLGDLERTTLDLVHADRVDQELGAQDLDELTHIQLRHEDLLEACEDVGQIRRQRIHVTDVHVPDRLAAGGQVLYGPGNRSVGAAPADNQHVAFLHAADLRWRDLSGDAGYLARADADHLLMV